tara:strand:+ start:2769 stop:2921 length:153 start_codon:yes stop_codon:yes gene_type:complete
MAKEMTPAQALSRLYAIARGMTTAKSLAKKSGKTPQKKNKGGSVKRSKKK